MSGHSKNGINFRLNIDTKITKYRDISKIETCGFMLLSHKTVQIVNFVIETHCKMKLNQ